MTTSVNSTHFGLTFPPDFPLDDKSCHQLAKILLLHPRITPGRAKYILNNQVFWQKIRFMSGKLYYKTSNFSFEEGTTKQKSLDDGFISFLLGLLFELFQVVCFIEDDGFKLFLHKLFSWIIEFSFPLPHELIEIADSLKVTKEVVRNDIHQMLFYTDMPAVKIFDYIGKYQKNISACQLDELLDLYLTKTKQAASSVQLELFTEYDVDNLRK